jgi:hypothetical protein
MFWISWPANVNPRRDADHAVSSHSATPSHIWAIADARVREMSATSTSHHAATEQPGGRGMTGIETHRRMRNRLLAAVAIFIYLALLTVWEIVTFQGVALEPIRVLVLGVTVGAMTGAGYVARQRWRLYLASRT